MPAFPPTAEQQLIIDAVGRGESLMVDALAGAAKTTTIEMAAQAIPIEQRARCIALAFNKKIQLELSDRLPFRVQTMNGLGHGAMMSAIRGVKIDAKKMSLIRKERFNDEPWETARLASMAKLTGIVPKGITNGKGLIEDSDDVWEALADDEDLPFSMIPTARELLRLSIKHSFEGYCDFDDQVYLPVCFGFMLPSFNSVFVDEAQDLSPLNHAMVRRLRSKQLVVVGDPLQSIYGFRGADVNSMKKLQEEFGLKTLRLTTCFRCPREVIREAQVFAPEMAWPEWAPEGEVRELPPAKAFERAEIEGLDKPKWNFSAFTLPVTVLCRNNAPLVKMGLKIARRVPVGFINGKLKDTLIFKLREICKWKKPAPTEVLLKIENWKLRELETNEPHKHGKILDLAESLTAACEEAEDYASIEASIEALFQAVNPKVLFGTGHSSKGLEWDEVLFLDRFLLPSKYAKSAEAFQQERNLEYVITTRAKRRLTYTDSRDFAWRNPLGAL